MHPYLFDLPNGTPLPTWGVIITATVLGLVIYGNRVVKRDGGYPKELALEVAILIFACHTIGGRVGYLRANWGRMDSWKEVFDLTGGTAFLESFGLIVVALAIYLYWRRVPIGNLFDLAAPLVPVGQAIGRFGCLFAGCCYGKPTDLPWGITFTHEHTLAVPRGVPLHPTQIYEMLYSAALAVFLIWYRPRRRFRGEVALIFLTAFPIFRIVLDMFRNDPKRGWFAEESLGQVVSNPQALAVVMLAGALVAWYIVPRLPNAKNLSVSGTLPGETRPEEQA